MRKLLLWLLLLASFSAPDLRAQYADLSPAGGPVAITAAWRFHTGDDLQWAAPDFDDSHWSLLRIDKTWAEQGYKGYYGFCGTGSR